MNGVKEIKREKVYIDPNLTCREVIDKYNIPETTAYYARKRGFFVKNYSKRQIMIDVSQFNHEIAVKIANKVFKRKFSRDDVARSIRDDMIQEAIVRQFELSGKPQTNEKYNKNYQYTWVAHNAMISYLKTWIRQMRYALPGDSYNPNMNPDKTSFKSGYALDFSWTYY